MTELFVSYAQHGEDVVLWRALGAEGPRFYVDVGAFDPSDDSVTRALYERGWRGINIEPQPARLALFERDRPDDLNVCVAVGSANGRATLYIPGAEPWATLDGAIADGLEDDVEVVTAIEVDVRTLDSIFAEHEITAVDVLKVDVEGREPDVIAGLDFVRVRPRVVIIEGVAPIVGKAAGDDAVRIVVDAGYAHCMFDGLNHYLTCEPGLVEALSVPANPVDGYVRAAITWYEDAVDGYKHQVGELQKAVTWLEESAEAHRAAEEPLPPPEPVRLVAPEVRAANKKATFEANLALLPWVDDLPELRVGERAIRRARVSDALSERLPADIVAALYAAILDRTPDPQGLRGWSASLADGMHPLALALVLSATDEALALPLEHRREVARELTALGAWRALGELAEPIGSATGGLTPGQVEHELLVRAVYRVCVGRPPTRAEQAAAVASLAAGLGREHFIRAYACRPATWRLLFGDAPVGLRARVWKIVGRRSVVGVVRDRVQAVEHQQIAFLIAATNSPMPVAELPTPEPAPTAAGDDAAGEPMLPGVGTRSGADERDDDGRV